MRGRRIAVVAVLLAAQAGAVAVYLAVESSRRTADARVQAIEPPRPAPPLRFADRDGTELGLDRFRGRPVLLYFWASWCPTCREQLPILARRAREDGRFVLVAPSLDREWGPADRVAKGLDGVYLAAPGAADAWGIPSLPAGFLLDGDGLLRARGEVENLPAGEILRRTGSDR